VILAVRTGVPADYWLDDPRALVTALAVIADADRRRK
jgi:hypothetical protein